MPFIIIPIKDINNFNLIKPFIQFYYFNYQIYESIVNLFGDTSCLFCYFEYSDINNNDIINDNINNNDDISSNNQFNNDIINDNINNNDDISSNNQFNNIILNNSNLLIKNENDININTVFHYKIKKTKINKLKKFDQLHNMIYDFNNINIIKIKCIRVFNSNKEFIVQIESNMNDLELINFINDSTIINKYEYIKEKYFNNFINNITNNFELEINKKNLTIENFLYEYIYINNRILIETNIN